MMKRILIDPWGAVLIKDYEKIFREFGVEKIQPKIRKKLKHYAFERNIIIGHRDFNKILARIENKQPFINMTGIATSDELHFGHKIIVDIFCF
jgi:tryptophanyl-tRNA synthetase